VGDVHGCADELGKLVHLAQPSRVVLVGDLFTKGPKPLETWRWIERLGAVAVLGNHDAGMLARPARHASMQLPPEAWAWLSQLPLTLEVGDWTVVHAGLNPIRGKAGTGRSTALVVRRWPDDTDPQHPLWFQIWSGPERVIYGHDAIRGLQDHRPRTLGIDTGCVYGGRLTGYLVEADEVISVPAARAYRPVTGPVSVA
jgi:hypothetical protein